MRTLPALLPRRLAAALLAGAALCAPVSTGAQAAETAQGFAAAVERAHGAAAWRRQQALQADLEVKFGGQTAVAGRLTFRPDMSASRLDLADGTVLVFDGSKAWVSPASAQFPGARFHLLTWPYFAALPFKLGDPGTRLEPLGERPLRGAAHPAARLTFQPGVGDAPDDWYVLYRDPANGRLRGAAYIVSYGKSAAEAAKEPHAILYDGFTEVAGVTLGTRWTFHGWSEEGGVGEQAIGEATLSNLRFVAPDAGTFARPADSREDALPPRP